MTDFVEPYSVVMRPQWNDTVAMVLPDWQVTGVSDPVHRVWLNPGVMMVRLTSESRFSGEVVFRRTWASADKIAGTLPPSGELFFTIGSEGGAEMWINLSGIPNTNDQANTRITVTVIPMSGGGVGFYSLPSLFGGGRCESPNRKRSSVHAHSLIESGKPGHSAGATTAWHEFFFQTCLHRRRGLLPHVGLGRARISVAVNFTQQPISHRLGTADYYPSGGRAESSIGQTGSVGHLSTSANAIGNVSSDDKQQSRFGSVHNPHRGVAQAVCHV